MNDIVITENSNMDDIIKIIDITNDKLKHNSLQDNVNQYKNGIYTDFVDNKLSLLLKIKETN